MPPIDLAKLSVSDAIKLADYPTDRKSVLEENRDFYNGDHWRNGKGWVGPWPTIPERSVPAQARVVHWLQNQIRVGFVSINAIKEGVDRDVMGVAGIEPRWGFAPSEIELPPNAAPESEAAKLATDKANQRAKGVEAIATRWWDTHGGHAHVQSIAEKLLYGAGPRTEAAGRFYVPASMLEDEIADGKATGRKLLRVTSIEDAADKIHFETLDADQGRVVRDPDTLAEIGIKPTKRGDEQVVEITYLDPTSDASRPMTVLATIRGDSRPAITLDLRGHLTMMTVTRKEFLTEQCRQSQKALNFSASMVKRNVETGGFLQDTIINADLPGKVVGEGEAARFVADPIERGPLALNSFRGIAITDDTGQVTGITTPVIDHRQPVDPSPTIKAKVEHYADILGGFNQRHVLIAGDATASGVARIQAKGDHTAELRRTQAPVERIGRWMIETVVLLANALANPTENNTVLDGLRATFSCQLDSGPIDPADRAENLAEMNAGALSRTTTIERNGIIDVDAELARIATESGGGLDAELKRAQVYGAWVAASVGEAFAAKRAGLSAPEIKELVTAQTDTVPAAQ